MPGLARYAERLADPSAARPRCRSRSHPLLQRPRRPPAAALTGGCTHAHRQHGPTAVATQRPRQPARRAAASRTLDISRLRQVHTPHAHATLRSFRCSTPPSTCFPCLRQPTILTIHDLIFEHYPEHHTRRNHLFLRAAVPRFARAADALIAVSHHTKRDLAELYKLPPQKIHVIHEGIDASLRARQPTPKPHACGGRMASTGHTC